MSYGRVTIPATISSATRESTFPAVLLKLLTSLAWYSVVLNDDVSVVLNSNQISACGHFEIHGNGRSLTLPKYAKGESAAVPQSLVTSKKSMRGWCCDHTWSALAISARTWPQSGLQTAASIAHVSFPASPRVPVLSKRHGFNSASAPSSLGERVVNPSIPQKYHML